MHTDRQIMFQVFSSTLMRLRSTRWSWVTCWMSSCTTTVSRCSIRLGRKHYQLFDNDLDKHVLETCMSGDWKRSTLMKHTVTFIRKTLFWKGSREDAKDWGPWSMTSSSRQQQNMLISQKERSRDGSIFFKRGRRRRQRLSILGCQKCLCSKGGESSFEHDTAKKGKGKGNRSRRPVHSDNSAERQYARKPGNSPSGEKKIVFRVSTAK